jgi:hypothetical protein
MGYDASASSHPTVFGIDPGIGIPPGSRLTNMNQKNILTLAAIAIVLVIGGVVASQKNASERKLDDGGLLAPQLRAGIDKVEDIRVVTRAGDAVTQITLLKKAGQWQVADRGYRADTAQLAKLINALAQAKRIEPKTSKPENYGRLGVRDPASDKGDGVGTQLRLLATDGKPQLELVIGAAAQGRAGQYVRLTSDKQVWLIDQALPMAADSAGWLDHDIVDIAPDDIVAVDFGGLVLKRPAADKPLELPAIPARRELSYEGVTAAAGSSLSQLQLKDVLASGAITLGKPAMHTVFTTKNNLTIAVDAHHQGEKSFLVLSAAALENADDAGRKQVETWNAAWQPWVFEVETFTYNKFVKSVNDFTKEKPKAAKGA